MKKQIPYIAKDTNGNILHAHGGQILKHGDTFYWIGENRLGRNKVACYSSKDLENWEFKNNILTLDSPKKEHYFETDLALEIEGRETTIGMGCNIERPKILYNDATKQFVMWMHWEEPDDYKQARCAIAVCDTIDGDYTYLGSFNPLGFMSRDCTLFKDDDGTAYFISASNHNQDLHMYRLTDDYLNIDTLVQKLYVGKAREAPTVFKKDCVYYMLSSACTGWNPNQSCYATANSIEGKWSELFDLGDETTYRSQPTTVVETDGEVFYVGDRWEGCGEKYFTSSYVVIPIEFYDGNVISLKE